MLLKTILNKCNKYKAFVFSNIRYKEKNKEQVIEVAKTIRNHKELILNWFRAKKLFSSGVVKGLNTKVKLTIRKAHGLGLSKQPK